MPAVILTLLTATKTEKGGVRGWGLGSNAFWISEHSRHSARCLINVIWCIFAHRLLGSCWDLHSTEKEPELGLGGLCLPFPTVGVNWKGRDLNTGLLVFRIWSHTPPQPGDKF